MIVQKWMKRFTYKKFFSFKKLVLDFMGNLTERFLKPAVIPDVHLIFDLR